MSDSIHHEITKYRDTRVSMYTYVVAAEQTATMLDESVATRPWLLRLLAEAYGHKRMTDADAGTPADASAGAAEPGASEAMPEEQMSAACSSC